MLTGILVVLILSAGFLVTSYLGDRARQGIVRDNEALTLILSSHLTSEFRKIEGVVAAMAGSPWTAPALASRSGKAVERANAVMDRYNRTVKASVTFLLDGRGLAIASSNRSEPDSFVGKSFQSQPYFKTAFKGHPFYYFSRDLTSGRRGYYAAHPVWGQNGRVMGVAVVKLDLDEKEMLFNRYPNAFLIHRTGVVFMSGRPDLLLKRLWPADRETREVQATDRQFDELQSQPLLPKEAMDGMSVAWGGNRHYVTRKPGPYEEWSVVLLAPLDRVAVYRAIGVISTLFVLLVITSSVVAVRHMNREKKILQESEEQYRTLAEKSFAGVYVVQRGVFQFINSQAAAYVGYAAGDMIGMKPDAILYPEDREKVKTDARAMLRGRRKAPHEFRIITKQGHVRWIMETVTSISYRGKPAILGNSMDITDQMEAEEELKRLYREIEDTQDRLIQDGRLAAIGRLAAGAAHEILNPLNIISMRIQLLESKGPLAEEMRVGLDTFKAQIDRIVRIVDGLKDFSRLSTARKEAVLVNEFVEKILEACSLSVATDQIELKKDFQSGLPLLYIDKKRTENAILHIINNAIDAMRGRDQRVLGIRTQLLDSDGGRSCVRIVVSDSGSGIEGENLQRIFDPFFTTKGPDRGTGLGLWVAYGAFKDHGGTIRVENNPTGGATFLMELPVSGEEGESGKGVGH